MHYERPLLASIFYAIAAVGLLGCGAYIVVVARHSNPLTTGYAIAVASGAIFSCLLIAGAGNVIDLLGAIAYHARALHSEAEARRQTNAQDAKVSAEHYRIPGLNG